MKQATIERALHWAIAANFLVATILLLSGDLKNAMLGLAGSAFFGLVLLISEGRP